ncbi:Ubiquitin-conjugating enzyme [Orobanche minor]
MFLTRDYICTTALSRARLKSEFVTLMTNGDSGISAFPEEDNMLCWKGTISGSKNTVFEGIGYKLSFSFPTDYPFKPPKVKFDTVCFHPNMDVFGDICLDILTDKWSSAYDVRTILLAIQRLCEQPNTCSPLNPHAAELWENQEEYRKMVEKLYKTKIRDEVCNDSYVLTAKRLQSDLMALMISGDSGISAFPVEDNIFRWKATISGSKYKWFEEENNLFILFLTDYPLKPPEVTFETGLLRNYIKCLDILEEDKWSSDYDVRSILVSIERVLREPMRLRYRKKTSSQKTGKRRRGNRTLDLS